MASSVSPNVSAVPAQFLTIRSVAMGSPIGATMAVDKIESKTGADKARAIAERLPRLVRFAVVGCVGLLADLAAFTTVAGFGHHPLAARLGSLGVATLVTWRLNRMLTFARSNRAQSDEAMRYLAVTAVAQGTSYVV